jgi:cell division septum initiation protein DivIVA
MASTGKERHRDREGGWRRDDVQEPAATDRVFRITDAERQAIAKSLRFIDDARRSLEQQQNPDNREIIRELRASADRIFDVVSGLEEIAPHADAAEP